MVYQCPWGFGLNTFIIISRKSRRKTARKVDNCFYAWYRDPTNGAKLPENRISIDTLNHRLNGGIRIHITSKAEAYRVAQEALNKGVVFNYQKVEKPRLIPYIEGFWTYETSDYVKRKLNEGSHITKMQCHKLLGVFQNHCKKQINPSLYLDQFKVADMERIKRSLFDKKLSSSLINQAIESIRTPLNEAYRQEIISDNIGSRLKNIKRTDKERGILSHKEAEAVIRYLKNNTYSAKYDRFKYLIPAIMYYSGMRNNEVTALTLNCIEIIDDKQSFIHVVHGYNRLDGVKSTKNGKKRVTTIPTELAREIISYANLFNPNGFIFFSPVDINKPIDDSAVRDSFYLALKGIGITEEMRTERNLTLYSLRHGFNTAMVNSGLGELEIRTVTGHSSVAMTEHYNHETDERLRKQAEARNKVLPYIN